MRVALIPARGGSKRIPGKNIKKFFGKPLISYAIEGAIQSRAFDKIVVSTDSEKIAEVALRYGAEVPFIRPSILAADDTPGVPVTMHALNWLLGEGYDVEYFCKIYANPFVTHESLFKGMQLLQKRKASQVLAVTTFPFPIYRALKLNDGGFVEFVYPDNASVRSQELPEAYHDVGQFSCFNCLKFMANPQVLQPDTLPLVIPRHMAVDIDTPEDWEVAEKLFRIYFRGKNPDSS